MNQTESDVSAGTFINHTAAPSLEEAERALLRATATRNEAIGRYFAGVLTETELEAVARAEAEARFVHLLVTQLPQMEQAIRQVMDMARRKFKETASLRDPRPFARGQG